MKKKFWKSFSIAIATITVITVITGVTAITCWKNGKNYVKFDKNRLNEVYTSLTVLDDKGEKLNEPLYLYNYKQIPLDALPEYAYMAFVAVEDKRFFEHNGIDYRRIAGAMLHNVKSGNYKEGASTISQQLIKNTHLNNSKTLERKANELFLARELERNYSKTEILEMYLNTIYFGRNAYGIETAANVYFNKSAADLTVSESAALAGMIKAPNSYAPDINLEKCTSRRNSVLKLMLEQNIINSEQYSAALESDVVYEENKPRTVKSYTYHVMKEACRILNMTPMQLAQSNFIIETYCNQTAQKELEKLASDDRTLTKDG
ncbi:MAG: transglycosylase domain-containing protein, partial [Firmicutes bacterium]|nr:transglycosylase domain-containing protein [Bacillota bacterium]